MRHWLLALFLTSSCTVHHKHVVRIEGTLVCDCKPGLFGAKCICKWEQVEKKK